MHFSLTVEEESGKIGSAQIFLYTCLRQELQPMSCLLGDLFEHLLSGIGKLAGNQSSSVTGVWDMMGYTYDNTRKFHCYLWLVHRQME